MTGYLVERCQGAGCNNFAQIGTAVGTTYNDTGLTSGTSYSYRVRATDAAGNLSPYSNVASARRRSDTQPPTAPTNLTATAISSSQINLSWTASTDNVGVTGYRVERCQGAGCNNFAQIGTAAGTTYNDTGLTAGTSYSYRVRATDAAGNLSPYSNVASATTQSPDTQPPTAPTNLTATAISGSQINLSWTASTDNVGVTGYLVERCQGAGCNNFAQIGTTVGTTYNDTGLTAEPVTVTGCGRRMRRETESLLECGERDDAAIPARRVFVQRRYGHDRSGRLWAGNNGTMQMRPGRRASSERAGVQRDERDGEYPDAARCI